MRFINVDGSETAAYYYAKFISWKLYTYLTCSLDNNLHDSAQNAHYTYNCNMKHTGEEALLAFMSYTMSGNIYSDIRTVILFKFLVCPFGSLILYEIH